MLLIAMRKGGGPCSTDCPFYTDTGVVKGYNGPLKTHCRMTMNPWIVDCDIFNVHCIEKLEITEQQWKNMQQAVHKRAKKVIKHIPDDHAEIHPVGWSWTHQDKWNAQKSASPQK